MKLADKFRIGTRDIWAESLIRSFMTRKVNKPVQIQLVL